MSKITTPRDLLVDELQDLYSAENQLLKSLPALAEAAGSERLKDALLAHHRQTEIHAARLEKILQRFHEPAKGKTSHSMQGLVEGGRDAMHEKGERGLLDLALIAAAQKAEHYEIAGYSSARHLAELAGEKSIAAILQETLDEEVETSQLLTEIAHQTDVVSVGVTQEN